MIEAANIIDAFEVPKDLITMNCRLRCEELKSRKITEVTLVYQRYANDDIGNVYIFSNLGIALFAARVGETVQCQKPAGVEVSWKIVEILYQPEDAGHYLI